MPAKPVEIRNQRPVCSQCASSGASCRYPPTNKRGIPSGYIALVEQRLLESEIVIFELLSTLYNYNPTVRQHRLSFDERHSLGEWSKQQSKAKKVEEWTNFPLGTDEQRQAWWLKKQDSIGRCEGSDAGNVDSPATNAFLGVLPDASPISAGFEETQQQQQQQQQQKSMDTPLPLASTVSETTTVLQHPWTSQMDSQSGSDADNSFRSSSMSGPPMMDERPQYATVNNSVNHASPEARHSTSDRWRKYF
ncbi:uncharacterized protein CC84DRAFT_1223859 [Paraphaeosphaeria sporulosa]|uniref:Zn(2)-C6 fungal-type domain-containing protein n=1 Tax=Paraphaeosphaeria sporulosa TaxID=1460663 RepID=A0A177CW60_9PLEO|nr:uncharacterized protein CC84DRAFT_1223859 [Paraphaeosphaeria sporulosa]OAG11132.1 hypothetical protein CC84DRAFT_1223859 [Paraphaeosphaeria sporulosa]